MKFFSRWFAQKSRAGDRMGVVRVNTEAPDFELADWSGKPVRLSDYRGKSNILLVFNRGFM